MTREQVEKLLRANNWPLPAQVHVPLYQDEVHAVCRSWLAQDDALRLKDANVTLLDGMCEALHATIAELRETLKPWVARLEWLEQQDGKEIVAATYLADLRRAKVVYDKTGGQI